MNHTQLNIYAQTLTTRLVLTLTEEWVCACIFAHAALITHQAMGHHDWKSLSWIDVYTAHFWPETSALLVCACAKP